VVAYDLIELVKCFDDLIRLENYFRKLPEKPISIVEKPEKLLRFQSEKNPLPESY
jgi:hypothetical protein